MEEILIVTGSQPDSLVTFAGEELRRYLERLFGVRATVCRDAQPAQACIFLDGAAVAIEPPADEQAFQLRRFEHNGQPAMVVTGGSPRATLWAVYELVERWGVRHLLHGDVLPSNPVPFWLPDIDHVFEPLLRVRMWRVINVLAFGPESWGMEDYRPVIDQLTKLKFNRILLSLWSHHPFVHFECRGLQRKTGVMFEGLRYPITDDMVGRALFGDASEFWNPDLPLNRSYEELTEAAQKLAHNLMDYAHGRGMECVVTAHLTDFPPEFAPLLKNPQTVHQIGELTVVPGADTDVDDPVLAELSAAVLQATVNTYPDADYIALGMPEFRQWSGQYESAWRALDARYGIEEIRSLADTLAASQHRSGNLDGPERALQEVKGDIVALYYYDRLLNDLHALADTRHPAIKLIYTSVAEELFPVLSRLLPQGAETLNSVDYSASRILMRREVLRSIASSETPSTLIHTLHDDNVGVLPQLTTGSLHELTQDLIHHGWAGFSTRYWLIGDHDPCVAYLSRTAWDASATPDAVYREQIRAACGEECVEDMLTVFREVETTTRGLEEHGASLTFPVPGMMMKHWEPEPISAELLEDRRGYERALTAARRARRSATRAGHDYVDYWIGRLEFGIGYLDTIQAVRLAAMSEAENDPTEAFRHTETALETACRALEAYSRIARDQSDRGAIATMNEYVYRPLKAKKEELTMHTIDHDHIPVLNPQLLGTDRLSVTRIPVGVPDDYKPCIAQLPDGEILLVAFHQHQIAGSLVREDILLFRSSDGGMNWSEAETLDLLGREPYLTVLCDGTIFITVHLLAEDVRNMDGYTHSYIHRSADRGQTWTTKRIGPEGFPPCGETLTCRNVLEMPDGTLLLGVDSQRGDAFVWRSTDRGETWDRSQQCDTYGYRSLYSYFGETVLWRARSGKLLNIVRVDSDEYPIGDRPVPEGNGDQTNHMVLYASTDNGRTMRKISDFGDYGEMYPSVLRLKDGRLLLTFTVRDIKPPFGVHAVLGVEHDDGFVFDFDHDRCVIDRKTPVGLQSGGGFGPTLQLDDETLVTAYSYRDAEGKTHLEVARWRLPNR